MPSGQLSPLIGFLRRIAAADGNATDGQLLERFADQGEETAFALLMQRHGPMVFDVCRRVLNDAHEAEDAFQATFLVLVRKARSIGRPELLGHWLYGVAYRTALKARTGAARRRAHERQVTDMPASESVHDVVWRDLRPVLDEEVNRLAAHYRAPFVLCCLEGRTKEEAACRLGLPEGTVSSRLARARERLRARLERRGIALSTGLLCGALADNLSAAVPAALAHSTLKAAALAAAGEAAAGVVSAQVAALTKGVLQAMFLTKLKIAGLVLLTLTVLGTGFGAATYGTRAGDATGGPADVASRQAANGSDKADLDRTAIQGTWAVEWGEADGRPLAARDRKMKWVITADHIIGQEGDNISLKLTYRLDPASTPKAIDMKAPLGVAGGGSMRGIYLLERNRLKVCYAAGSRERPDEFVTSRGSERILLVLRRRPPVRDRQEPPPRERDAAEEDSAKNDREAIQGTWVMVYNDDPGRKGVPPPPQERKWVIGPDSISMGTGTGRSLSYRLDPTQSPKQIDLQVPQAPQSVLPGIYMLRDNRLLLCVTVHPGDPKTTRPTDFTSQDDPSRNRRIWVFKRAGAAHETGAQARHRLKEEKAELEQNLKQSMSDIEGLKATITDLKRRKAEEDEARAREEEAKAQEEAEVGRLTLENLRLKEQLQRLRQEVQQLQKEQRSLESPTRRKPPAGN